MRPILFFPLTKTNWSVMSRLAMRLKELGGAKPVLVISNKLISDLAANFYSDVEIVTLGRYSQSPEAKLIVGFGFRASARRRVNHIKTRLLKCDIFRNLSIYLKKKEISKLEERVAELLTTYSPSAIVVAADRNTGIEPSIIKIAKSRQIVTVIPPIAFAASKEGLMIVRREHAGHIVTNENAFKMRFPSQWVKDPVTCQDVSFYSISLTHAYSELKMLSPQPWVMGAGLTDWILADSEFVAERYLASGVPAEKIVITGHMEHDRVAETIARRSEVRRILEQKYRLATQKKIIILPLTNWAEHNFMPQDWHWRECEFLCQVAVEQDANVLVPLHPTQKREDYLRLEALFPSVRVLEEPLSEVLGVADVYLTGLGSSTVLWAVMVGIPVVIADHYHEKDHMHMGLPGVLYVQSKELLGDAIHRLLNDPDHYGAIKNEQIKAQPYFGKIDGQSTQRIVSFICDAEPRRH
jgi:hypothetical protein